MDGETAAKFFFSDLPQGDASYVAQIGGDTANKGVIGVILFAEDRPAHVFRDRGGAMFASSASASKGMLRSAPLSASNAMPEAQVQAQSMGTGFGEATEFRTHTAEFKRGAQLAQLLIHYDGARGLKRRGIDVSRPAPRPSAFPADELGCATPPGWQR